MRICKVSLPSVHNAVYLHSQHSLSTVQHAQGCLPKYRVRQVVLGHLRHTTVKLQGHSHTEPEQQSSVLVCQILRMATNSRVLRIHSAAKSQLLM